MMFRILENKISSFELGISDYKKGKKLRKFRSRQDNIDYHAGRQEASKERKDKRDEKRKLHLQKELDDLEINIIEEKE